MISTAVRARGRASSRASVAGQRPGRADDPAVPAASVRLERISHSFGTTRVIDDVSLDIGGGEFVALLGPSGCGKSTLLRILAGLQAQSAGSVLVDGVAVDGLAPRARGVGIVFQNYALFPHMTALANVAYGLEAGGEPRASARRRAAELLERVQIGALGERLPRELSGGQQQRVALARTLAVTPRILLLDEPLAALDRSLRLDMQIEIRRLQRELGITTVMVTHDQDEAMSMADRVAVLSGGALEQYDTPAGVYDRPATPFVAGFVGATNLLCAEMALRDGRRCLRVAGGTLPLEGEDNPPGPVRVSIRPEQWELAPAGHDDLPQAEVILAMPLGPTLLVDLRLADGTTAKLSMPRSGDAATPQAGSRVALRLRLGAPVRIFA